MVTTHRPTAAASHPLIKVIERAIEADIPAYRLTGSHWAVPSQSELGIARIVMRLEEGRYTCNCPAQGVCWHIGAVLVAESAHTPAA